MNKLSKYLNDVDFSHLQRFFECCEDSDADGHDVPKDSMRRLCEIGCVRSIGFGRHVATSFGCHVMGRIAYSFPLKTYAEIDEENHASN